MSLQVHESITQIAQEAESLSRYDKSVNISLIPNKKKWTLVWRNIIIFTFMHIWGVYAIYAMIFRVKWITFYYTYFVGYLAALGVTAGAHRLWAHKSYKARVPLKILLIILNSISFQGPVIDWVRDHRMHHKYSETDADPHNAKRGFFFSHIGWLMLRKHPEVKANGHTIDLSDVYSDPFLRFQKRYYIVLALMGGLAVPSFIPMLWGETVLDAIASSGIYRCLHTWHATYLVNSAAHLWGIKPYDKNINPVEINIVSYLTLGEGYHNYHHTFPWDYKAAEMGGFPLNLTRIFIDFMAKIGWAYDLKSVSPNVIRKRVERTGDGSHGVWGWDDKSILAKDRKAAVITNREYSI